RLIDIFAIIATLFGNAAALGIAAIQIGEGVTIVAGVSDITNTVLAILIAALMVGFVISAVSGVSRGIRSLSTLNITFTIGIVGLVFFLVPTLFLLNLLPSAVLGYIGSFFDLVARSGAWGQETVDFQSSWTV